MHIHCTCIFMSGIRMYIQHVCMFILVHTIYIYKYAYICTCIYIHMIVRICICRASEYIYNIFVCLYLYVQYIYIYAYICTCINVRKHCTIYIYMSICISICRSSSRVCRVQYLTHCAYVVHAKMKGMCAYTRVCIYTCAHMWYMQR